LYLGSSFADATLYGNIDQTYNSTKTTTAGVVTNQQTNFSAYQQGQSFLGVKGAEDLGNGLKASYLYEFGLSTDTSATPTNRQSYVGLSGGFGALRIGKQYSNAFMNAISSDPGGATGGAGALYLAALTGYNGTEAPLRQDKGIQYDLPNFVPGLTISLTKVVGNANSANLLVETEAGVDYTNSGTNGVKSGDGQGVSITYTSGGLRAGFTTDTVTNKGINFGTVTVDNGDGTTSSAANTIVAASTDKNKLTTLALSYDLGMAKPSYSNVKMSVGSQSLKVDMFAVSVPLGAATVFISSSSGKADLTGSANDLKLKGMQYGLNYGLSKRTVAYWHAGNHTITDNTTGNAIKTTGFGIGVHHSF
jgi:predicted porin